MTSALRWAVLRAILMFHNCERQSHKTVPTDHNFSRERRAEAVLNRGSSAYQPNALPPGQTGSQGRSSPCGSLLDSAILRSRADSLRSHVILHEWLTYYTAFLLLLFIHPPKWCTYSAVWLLHGWCHVKLLPSRRVPCPPCNHAPCHITSCKSTYVGCMRV